MKTKLKKQQKKKDIKLYSKTYLNKKLTLIKYHNILLSVLESQKK
jgi:hypothetical protein